MAQEAVCLDPQILIDILGAWEIILPELRKTGAILCTVGAECMYDIHATTSDWTLNMEICGAFPNDDAFYYISVHHSTGSTYTRPTPVCIQRTGTRAHQTNGR
jgi:hypothetical protein